MERKGDTFLTEKDLALRVGRVFREKKLGWVRAAEADGFG